ncbi:MAG: type II 3-dehydroquinate dehydratase [Candidatus Marinimicrobia bacterium]|nr:type II 3-dehydroquinate dehydratase [Candidatus Neomarinimicrobiota bacterium]
MKILVIQGPNLNLLGLLSKGQPQRVTLDRLNKELRSAAATEEVKLSIYQLQDEARASKIIQQHRSKAAGLLLLPGIWGKTGNLLLETTKITALPLAVGQLILPGSPWGDDKDLIFSEYAGLERKCNSLEEVAALLVEFIAQLKK